MFLPPQARSLAVLLLPALLLLLPACRPSRPDAPQTPAGDFTHWMNVGKNYYDRGDALRALEPFQKAAQLTPTSAEAHLNLANAYLLAASTTNNPALLTNALTHANRAATLDPNLAAAHYVAGCTHLRLRNPEAALKSLSTSRQIAPKVGATTFQLARAHQELSHWDDAINFYQELTSFEPNNRPAWYGLSQCLVRAGRQQEATAALEKLQNIPSDPAAGSTDPSKLERCIHTQALAPFILEQPSNPGIPVRFTDITPASLPSTTRFTAPIGFIDFNHDGRNSLFAAEDQGFRLLVNSNATFHPHDPGIPASPTNNILPSQCFVADLQNDRFEDILITGTNGTRVFRFATNAQIFEATGFSRLGNTRASSAALLDLDFTGKLDLLAINPTNGSLQLLRNGGLYFRDITATSGVPTSATGFLHLIVEDWNHDDTLDVIAARRDQPPALLLKARGGPLQITNSPPDWPSGSLLAGGDINNDLRGDFWIATPTHLQAVLNGDTNHLRIPVPSANLRKLLPIDYDNDGWLDLAIAGPGLRMFRNLASAGFKETTSDLGLDKSTTGTVLDLAAADIDNDGDIDLALALQDKGLQILRNDGANTNLLLKVRPAGNRSNASGFGARIEIHAGGLRLARRVDRLPVEIGVAQHRTIESVNARWSNLDSPTVDVTVDPRSILPLDELRLPEGSCPYVFVWDGSRFRFVTDILGAAPLGLRVSDNRFVEGDPDELVWLGDSTQVQPLDGQYVLQITEELREVLYLDTAALVAVDHPQDTEVYTTGKMVPGPPFPPHHIITLHQPRPLLHAVRNDGTDLTAALQSVDSTMAGPVRTRIPQLRGLAEPWSLTLDFGPLPSDQPLVLAMTAWLRFGGGMANVGASHDESLPFPFPSLEVETGSNQWQPVDLVFGVPCGKTKNFIVDLEGKLPHGSHRLRISSAYELYWDRIALLTKAGEANTHVTRLLPTTADLHYRGFGLFEDLPDSQPLTPSYARTAPLPAWRITPAGWCTRYGDVSELVSDRDNALTLLNGGDELTLTFPADQLPVLQPGLRRGFFLFTSGWDKDSDFHCEKGWEVGPLPWHGLQYQAYGTEPRPAIPTADALHQRYNTRWVGPWVPRPAIRRP